MIYQQILEIRRIILAYVDASDKLEITIKKRDAIALCDKIDMAAALVHGIEHRHAELELAAQPKEVRTEGNVVAFDPNRLKKPKTTKKG